MNTKSHHEITINLTEEEKLAIDLTGKVIKRISTIIDTCTERTFEEYFEDTYNNSIDDFLYTLMKKPKVIEEEIAELKEEDF